MASFFNYFVNCLRSKGSASTWNTETRFRYKVEDLSQRPVERPPFIVTSLDSRKHNPQSKQIFHIHRINAKVIAFNSEVCVRYF